jgi:hypothetical protein
VTGLVYVAIVALWAAVLIPMWLRRHDDDQARRVERHRVAMGTLARMSDSEDSAHGAAASRRRFVLAASVTVGAIATGAWIAGLLPGVAVILAWIPTLAFLPAAVIAERLSARRAADIALQRRRARRRPTRAVPSPDAAVPTTLPASRRTATAIPASLAWEDVFDQTA